MQARAAALKSLGRGLSRIGPEVGDLELETLDVDRTDAQIGEREVPDASGGVERERQPAHAGAI
jgi:hypothetical protein